MGYDKILIQLNEYLKSEDITILLDLKSKLKVEVQKSISLKTNSKSRVNAIARIQKENEKHSHAMYNGYAKFDNQYIFTNTYIAFALNDNLGYQDNLKNISSVFDISKRVDNGDIIELNCQDILYNHKIKNKFMKVSLNNYETKYNVEYLKMVIDILGTDLVVYEKDTLLYIENKDNEKCVIMGVKTY